VRDGVLLRLIGKWLNAGVMEEGNVSYPDAGSPQGGVISPLLANVFLHYVLDTWFRQEVQPRLRGSAHLVRYADDFVILFTEESDARRVMEVLPKRFGKYGLALHPDKTRLIPFRRPPYKATGKGGGATDRPGTFDLLGFTHYWGRALTGGWAVKRKTVSKRLGRAVRSIAEWCRNNRHRPVCEQHYTLSQKVRGHYAYYGITCNMRMLREFLHAVHRAWRHWLSRRNRQRQMNWARFQRLLQRYPLPLPRIVHSYVK
jgi:RNA-directed DNA polymerase